MIPKPTDTQLARLLESDGHPQFKAVVIAPRNTVSKHFFTLPKGTPQKTQVTYELYDTFLLHQLTATLKTTAQKDKVMLGSQRLWLPECLDLMVRLESYGAGVTTRVKVNQRLKIVAGLALAAILPGATFQAYPERQVAAERVMHINGMDVWKNLSAVMAYTGDTETDFKTAFHYLWFQLPYAVTDMDAHILRVSLEQV